MLRIETYIGKYDANDSVCWSKMNSFLRTSLPRATFRSSHQRCSIKKGVFRNFTKFTGNTCARVSFLIKLQALKKRLWHRCFPVNFAKFLRTPFYGTPLDDCFWTFLLFEFHVFLYSSFISFCKLFNLALDVYPFNDQCSHHIETS